jgi:hypothetical protein
MYNFNKFAFSTKCDKLIYPVKRYKDAKLLKNEILQDNKNKSGIYC